MKKILIATMITAIAAVSFAAPSEARNRHHRGEALALGLAFGIGTGLLIGSSNRAYATEPRECWIEKQHYYDHYGNLRVQKVRVCEE